jgi:pyruvate/2-oxoglutarate/acetoin dehydrogenase E1 component
MAKFRQMYNNQVKVPVVIRTPMGGGRGYGPTHSQSLEKIFLGIPGLRVIAPSHFHDPGEILKYIIQKEEEPVIFIEHKLLYPMKIITNMDNELSVEYILNKHKYPISIVKNYKENRNPDVIIISYGGISYLLEPLLRDLYKDEIYIIAFLLSEISDFSVEFLFDFIINCGKIIIIEEGTGYFGWSAEISAQIYEKYSQYLAKPIKRLTSFNSIIPAAKHLENKVLPNRETLERLIEEMIV